MLLQRLYELRQNLRSPDDIPPAYYKEQFARWLLEIDGAGRFVQWTDPTTQQSKKGLSIQSPYRSRSGQTPPPFLLVDKQEYVLGVNCAKKVMKLPEEERNKKNEKAVQKHDAFLSLLHEFFASTDTLPHALQAVKQFFEGQEVEKARAAFLELSDSVKEGDLIAFLVDGELFPHQNNEAATFWARFLDGLAGEKAKFEAECLLTGRFGKIAQTHPIEFLVGPDRTKLVTANASPFESYGLKKSAIAPISITAAREYGEALTYLLSSEKHKWRLADLHYVFWTENNGDFDPFNILSEPDVDVVQTLFKSPLTGKQVHVEPEAFYAAAMSAQKSRLAIRDYIESTIEAVQQHLRAWFEAQALIDVREGVQGRPLGVAHLAVSLVRKFENLSPQILPMMLQKALQGKPLTPMILMQIIRRIRANTDNPMPYNRAVLLKMVLNDLYPSTQQEKKVTEQLNLNDQRPAYLCGRLFALLEKVQRRALGRHLNATIADRFYGTASTAPASVFGRLIRGSKAHLQKLRKGNETGGFAYIVEQDIATVLSGLQTFPRVLTLEQQGLFSIGYYHQKADDTRRAKEHKAQKEEQKEQEENKEQPVSKDKNDSPQQELFS